MLFVGNSTPIICCTSYNEIKNAITVFCREKDTVMEFGAEFSEVSTHLCQTIGSQGKAILVDTKRSKSKIGTCKHRNLDIFLPKKSVSCDDELSFVDRTVLINLEKMSDWKDKAFDSIAKYDVIIINITHLLGHDLYMTVLTLTNEILNSLSVQPRTVIVKSKTLYSLSRRLVHSQRLFDGTTKLPVNLERTNEPYIIATYKVDEYRKTIPFIVKESDAILEVGCHFGCTTNLLNKAGRYCIGVDIGPKIIANAKKHYPDISFAVGDTWKTLSLLKFRKFFFVQEEDLGYDLVYADIGGLSGSEGHLEALSLLDALGSALEPKCVVIKSACMRQLASRFVFFPNVWNKFQETSK
mmetsp:Transcript_18894/g.21648  ORF Transcript_18894/g.21648 Transcript_18894/m.21648 type:complete len:354 (-) Transcript_18894:308-1369(-)